MPAPIGQESRGKKFLLRMTAGEDAFVRARAVDQRSSLNETITQLIRDAMAAEEEAERKRRPAPPPKKTAPRTPAGLVFSHIEGQTSITDDDQ